jgi:hypothetical protein
VSKLGEGNRADRRSRYMVSHNYIKLAVAWLKLQVRKVIVTIKPGLGSGSRAWKTVIFNRNMRSDN